MRIPNLSGQAASLGDQVNAQPPLVLRQPANNGNFYHIQLFTICPLSLSDITTSLKEKFKTSNTYNILHARIFFAPMRSYLDAW